MLGATIGRYSHSLPYFIPGSYYFSDILGFILHTVTSAKGTFTRYDLSDRFCSRSVINLSFSTIGSLKLLQNNINSTT